MYVFTNERFTLSLSPRTFHESNFTWAIGRATRFERQGNTSAMDPEGGTIHISSILL